MSRRDSAVTATTERDQDASVIDVRAATALLRERDASAGLWLLVGTFLAAGVGVGATALLYDAFGSTGGGAYYSPGASLIGTVRTVAPLVATAGGLHVGRRIRNGQKAWLSAAVGAAVGHVGFSVVLYVFEGFVTEFGEIGVGAQFGLTLGVAVAGAIGALVGARGDRP